uniref:(E,E)-germacrene B synthase-like n=1 Tax=Nicotiana tabacum TaxID=4097 RepID=A0A1S4CD32_TOBAC
MGGGSLCSSSAWDVAGASGACPLTGATGGSAVAAHAGALAAPHGRPRPLHRPRSLAALVGGGGVWLSDPVVPVLTISTSAAPHVRNFHHMCGSHLAKQPPLLRTQMRICALAPATPGLASLSAFALSQSPQRVRFCGTLTASAVPVGQASFCDQPPVFASPHLRPVPPQLRVHSYASPASSGRRIILSLYEAAHLRVYGEEILEEALTFTTTHLVSMVLNLSNNWLKVQITEALSHPIRKTVPRVVARKYIYIYENIEAHDDLLLKFAKLDFNMLQKLHQRELSDLTSWWKDLDLINKLPYVRDKLVESYFWMFGVYFDPRYSRARKMQIKVFKMISTNDDTFDAYATYDDLCFSPMRYKRWDDICAMDSLPPYMSPLYQANLDIFNEMEEELAKEGKSERIYYGKVEMKKLVRAYFKEAKWLNAGYNPKGEEYNKNALVTAALSLVGMEEVITKDIFEWITSEPSIVRASSTIPRLMDDIIDHEL